MGQFTGAKKTGKCYSRVAASRAQAWYSTGSLADICGVAPRTVSKWIDRGQLVGHRLPGSTGAGDRRVHRDDLIAFLRARGWTRVLAELDILTSVLLVGADSLFATLLQTALGASAQVLEARTGFEAGAAIMHARPAAAVLCLSGLGITAALQIRDHLGAGAPPVSAVAIYPEDTLPEPTGWTAVLQEPTDPQRLALILTPTLKGV